MTTEAADGPDITPQSIDSANCLETLVSEPEADGIDFEDIYRSTQPHFEAARHWFSSEDYATHEEAMAALLALIRGIGEEVRRDAASNPPLEAPRCAGHPQLLGHLRSTPARYAQRSGVGCIVR